MGITISSGYIMFEFEAQRYHSATIAGEQKALRNFVSKILQKHDLMSEH
jgi:hypothetical protein